MAEKRSERLFSNKDGEFHLVVGLTVLRDLGIRPDDVIIATLRSDPDPNTVDIPPEFEEALEHDAAASKRFATFSPGKKAVRGLLHYASQAGRNTHEAGLRNST